MFRDLVAASTSRTLGSFARIDGKLAYIAMSEVGALDRTVGKVAEYRNFMLFVYFFDEQQVASLRDSVDWADLDISLVPPRGPRLPIASSGGAHVAYLTWDFPRHGQRALGEAAPAMGGAFFLSGLSAIGLAFRVSRTNRRLERARQDALDLAHRDPLTGLLNRRALEDEAKRLLAGGGNVHALMIDFDGFKEINDAFGHRHGDALLIEMSRRMQAHLPDGAVLARQGGDEFAVLHATSEAEAMEMGYDLVMVISAPFETNGQVSSISASIGVAGAGPGMTADELLRRADAAMYAAKTERAGQARLYQDALDAQRRLERQLDADMRGGLERGEFWVAYQPILSGRTGEVVAVEALARWRHAARGEIVPGVFIPIAERSRFIIELGSFVLRTACRRLAADGGDIALSVNLSPAQMLDDSIVEQVAAVLVETGLAPHRLELEVTEGYLIEQEERAVRLLSRLRALGVRISLDDFGSGYASVGYLTKFPLDKVKIDRSFVTPTDNDAKARDVLAAMVALCRAFEMAVTAEGVETETQSAFLRKIGCDRLQGYLFGKPHVDLPANPALQRQSRRA